MARESSATAAARGGRGFHHAAWLEYPRAVHRTARRRALRPVASIVVLLTAAACVPNAGAATRRLRLDPSALTRAAEVDERFLSVAVDVDQVVGGTFWDPAGGPTEVRSPPYDFTRPRLRALAGALAPAYLRIGGSAADRTFYDVADPPAGAPPPPYQEVLSRAQWDAVNEFAAALGFGVVLTVNAGDGPRDATGAWIDANARALLAYTASRGYAPRLLQFGNEPNLFAVRAGVSGYDAAAYARELAAFVALRDAVLPGVPIGGPGNIFTRTLLDDVVPGVAFGPRTGEALPLVAGMLDVVEYHYYAAVSTRCPPVGPRVTPETALEAAYLDGVDEPAAAVAALRDRWAPGTPIWLTESGGQSCGGQLGVGDRFVNAFWFLSTLGRLARAGQAVFVRQTLSGSTYGLIAEPSLEPQPDYWAALLWRRLMGPRALALPAPPAHPVRVFAHCTRDAGPGAATVLVLNAGERPYTVRVRSRRRLAAYVVTSGDAEGRAVRVNGRLAAAAPDGTPPAFAPRARRGSMRVPPRAYAFVVVPAGVAACTGS